MTFKPGNHNMHDLAAAGRKGKARSPWNAYAGTRETLRLHVIRRAAERVHGLPRHCADCDELKSAGTHSTSDNAPS